MEGRGGAGGNVFFATNLIFELWQWLISIALAIFGVGKSRGGRTRGRER